MPNIIEQGLILMVLGMGVVFAFLVLLVFVINISTKIINRFFPEKPEEPQQKAADNTAQIAAAIAAVHHKTN